MSDGGRNNEWGIKRKQQGEGSDDYGRAISKIAVSQICENVGFESLQQSSLDLLSEITLRYLRDLGKTAHFYANIAGRSDCNVFDIIQGLEDLGPSQGDVKGSFESSSTVKEIMQYVSLDDNPFAQDVTQFPLIKRQKPTPSFLQVGETPEKEHIPAWLPAFPDRHTYIHTPVWNERKTDPRTDKIEQARQRRKEERSLFSLQQRLACNGSSVFATTKHVDYAPGKQRSESNPFLAPPLRSVAKDVPPVAPLAEVSNVPMAITRSSVLEAFAPAMGTTNIGLCDSTDDDSKVLPNKRPVVNFKLGVSKKSLGVPLDLTLQSKSVGQTAHLIVRGDVMDEKKKKAEQILRESMNNLRELS
ncbi:Transcription initiation factor tfiid subunit [Thalictrum thalictroides]|uniref:Transcription initiation factor TFIID subunit 8 n=1 Tax=Thalictrum thalictroides TaxID=46969 RepID=A0A7J6WY27_THATH|nr:Transcription initiation factor tfiid subunit [Thalictrum thalictroides]